MERAVRAINGIDYVLDYFWVRFGWTVGINYSC